MTGSRRPIVAVQIQTVDACNASCIICPHKSVAHTGQTIDDRLFARIVDQIAAQVAEGRIVEAVEINLFFQNEPLLDGKLFERASQVRDKLPRAHLVCFTNGLLLAQRKRALLESTFDLLSLSLYGDDARSFNRVTGLRLGDQQVAAIVRTTAEIERSGRLSVATSPAWREVHGRKVLYDFSSRAGFYTGKVLHRAVTGCKEGRDRWLHFRADGELVLCCMDWEHETCFGNIGERSLGALLGSEAYQELRGRVCGDLASPRDFICKRCEWAVPARESRALGRRKKTLVLTSAGPGDEPLLGEWLTSLRTLGDYHGEVLVLDHGLGEEGRTLATGLGARLERPEGDPSNGPVVAALPILERFYKGRAIGYFDVATWFQGAIAPLFAELDHVPGCLYSVRSATHLEPSARGPATPPAPDANEAKVAEVIRRCKGPIHGGFVAGRYRPFVEKLTLIKRANTEGSSADGTRTEYLVNVLFDFGRDRANGYRWSCRVDEAQQGQDGRWYHLKHSDMWLRGDRWMVGTRREEPVVGIRLADRRETRRFGKYHPECLQRLLDEVSPPRAEAAVDLRTTED